LSLLRFFVRHRSCLFADARAKAKAGLVQVAQGIDPAAEKQAAREAITVSWPHSTSRNTPLTGELNVSRLVVSKLLNHAEPGVTKVYDRASYDKEKQAALAAWARRLDAIIKGKAASKVVPLRA
jgi:hypothetical protein